VLDFEDIFSFSRLAGERMRRRDFIGLVAGATAAGHATWPRTARAQPALPVIGFLRSAPLADSAHLVAAFRRGLKEAGFVEGQSVAIEFRSADNQLDRLPALVAELIGRPVAAIAGNGPAALAAKAATATLPIVFAYGGDPVRDGLVSSINRPGGNVTGVQFIAGVLGAKRLELLRQLVPKAATIGVLVGPGMSNTVAERKDVEAAARAIGQELLVIGVDHDRDIEPAFATFVQRGAGALYVGSGPFTNSRRGRLAALAARHKLPASYNNRDAVIAGGLMSYGTNIADAYRQVGLYAARILKGEKPGDLPVMLGTKFEFVLNLKTAKTLGLEIPPNLLALSDEVIE
jgi:putative ABC transport system substrate-binding protein